MLIQVIERMLIHTSDESVDVYLPTSKCKQDIQPDRVACGSECFVLVVVHFVALENMEFGKTGLNISHSK